MKRVGTRVILFGGALFLYSKALDEPQLTLPSTIFILVGLGLFLFGPQK